MCQLMHIIIESTFNVIYEESKVEYVDKPDVRQYIEGGNFGPSLVDYSTKDMLTLSNVVERYWQFIKYTPLRGGII